MSEKQEHLSITLSLDDLNTVLEALGELPAKRTHRIMNNLQLQAMQQLNKPQPAPAPDAIDDAIRKVA